MSENNESLALLPNGFIDLLPPFAEGEAKSIQTLMEIFSSFGYRRIKPPLLEFEDSLLAPGPGERLANETFRLMDPISHRMMGIRSDITAQVSRIVSARLGNELRPLRLTYASDVLRTRGSQIRTERQFMQVGCELIGGMGCAETDIEICVLSLLGLKSLGIKDIILDLTIPGFVASILYDVNLDKADIIKKAVAQRDIDALKKIGNKQADLIAQAMSVSGCADEGLSVLSNIGLDDALQGNVERLKNVCAGINSAMIDLGIDDVSLTIDVLEQDGFEYHKALGFTLFSSNISGELGRGGCYDVHFGKNEDDEMAKGFTLYMDSITQFSSIFVEGNRVFVGCDTSWCKIIDLQSQGWIVVRGAGADAAPSGCTHIYENGKIIELS